MLEYNRIEVSQITDVNKADGLRDCIIYHCWCFLEMHFKFQPEVCNGSHDLMETAMSFNDVAIVTFKGISIEFIFCI